MIEIWEDIENYEGYYQVSNLGRVKSLSRSWYNWHGNLQTKKENYLKGLVDSDGYLNVSLSKNNITAKAKIHRLVAMAFIPNPENKLQVNHKKGIKSDNRVSEIEWVTGKENVNNAAVNNLLVKGNNHPNTTLTHIHVKTIRDLFATGKYTKTKLAHIFSISISGCAFIIKRKVWKHI